MSDQTCRHCDRPVVWVDAVWLDGHVSRLAIDAAVDNEDGRWILGVRDTATQITGYSRIAAVAAGEQLHVAHYLTCPALTSDIRTPPRIEGAA